MLIARRKILIEKRKEPEQPRARHTVEAIFEATAQLLERDQKASTNRIAERAGVSIGTVYQYFPNAAAILATIAERERNRIGDAIRAAVAQIDPDRPEATVRSAIRALLHAFGRRQKLRRRILLTLMPIYARQPEGRFMEELTQDLLALLAERTGDRFVPLDDAAAFVLSRAIMGAVRAAIIEQAFDLVDPRFEDQLVRLALAFIGPADPRHRPPAPAR